MNVNQIVLFFLVSISVSYADDFDLFIEDINNEWALKNYTNILQHVDSRLTSHTNDLSALILKMNYFLMVEYDLSKAQDYVTVFTNTVTDTDWSSDVTAKIICDALISEVVNPLGAQNHGVIYGLSSNQLNEVHATSPTNHPLSEFLRRIGAVQYSVP